jgi:glycine hydroxymethyltransferase
MYCKGVRSTNKKGNDIMYDLESKINFSVFPGMQGGPHNHTISALATALHQCKLQEYKDYQIQVLKNNSHYADTLVKLGYTLVSGGTDNHLLLVNLQQSKGIDGARCERVMELANLGIYLYIFIYLSNYLTIY